MARLEPLSGQTHPRDYALIRIVSHLRLWKTWLQIHENSLDIQSRRA
jgi:hypothetical protein